eukprot:XP_025013384.1 F-box protein At3g56470-like [Ricinus communis]
MESASENKDTSAELQRDIVDDKAAERKWSDLPLDILPMIAGRLGIIDLISFRSVCKDWKSASATASAEIESSPLREPWFLLYGGEASQCLLLSRTGNKYTINIPEMNGATCIASKKGWLLLLREEDYSIYFFCPFSRAKIDLPKLQNLASVPNHLAAFPSAPTSQDCFVSIVCRDETSSPEMIQLYVLLRGDKEWTKHTYSHTSVGELDKIKCVAYYDDELHIMDARTQILITYSFKTSMWKKHTILHYPVPHAPFLKFCMASSYFQERDLREKLDLEGDVSVTICGSAFKIGTKNLDRVIFSESIDATGGSVTRRVKGVWIHPRFFILPPNQSW